MNDKGRGLVSVWCGYNTNYYAHCTRNFLFVVIFELAGHYLCMFCLSRTQYVNTRLEMVDSSQSPEIISLTSGVQ